MAAKRRKKGKAHPGVVLMKPNEAKRMWWRARYTDPDTGKVVTPTLPRDLTQAEQREDWAADKSEWIATRKAELRAGAVPVTNTDLETTIEHYFTDNVELDEDTIKKRRVVSRKLIAWAKRVKITKADDLTQPALMDFRAHLVREPKRKAKPGGKRGEYVSTGERRKGRSVNHDIGEIVTVLRYLRKKRLFSRITLEDIEASMSKVKLDREQPTFLKPAAIKDLLIKALAHDAQTFELTRAEARGAGVPGDTAKYPPIAPFVLFVLMTGMREDESWQLDWGWIDLDAPDEDGKPIGEIDLPASVTKTGIARKVQLDVSRVMRDLLCALQPDPKLRKGSVFGLTEYQVRAALERLQESGADTHWQELRRTTGTYLTCAPCIYGAAAPFMSAAQLGHSVPVAQKHYLGRIRISREARTLEAAMQIDAEADRIVEAQWARVGVKRKAKAGRAAAAHVN